MKDFLDKMSEAYYNGKPEISDEEFDILAESYNYKNVGYSVEGGVKLPFPMFSLQKFYKGETESPLKKELLVESPKLDGASLALIYINGELKSLITRGDGKVGKDISHLIPEFPAPKYIDKKGLIQITGEVVAPKEIPNARNYASGALGLKDPAEFATRNVLFIAYGVEPYQSISFKQDMHILKRELFNTVLDSTWNEFPQDGKVFRLDNHDSFKSVGFTYSHPRGAYALKERVTGPTTKLLDVIWQVGKSGIVSPVAILEPVDIDGARVARATLHNMAYINALGLKIGCTVEVVRSGGIIPRVVKVVSR